MKTNLRTMPNRATSHVLFEQRIEVASLPVVYQAWAWQGKVAECLIFKTEDIETLTENALIRMVLSSPFSIDESSIEVGKSKSGSTMVSFNYETMRLPA